MNEHDCLHEKDFGTVFTKIDNLIETVEAQTKVITDLVTFQTSIQAINGYKDKEKFNAKQRAGIIMSGILGISSITVTIILKFV
jgi:hypothetical protein